MVQPKNRRVATEAYTDNATAGKSNIGHTHDTRYAPSPATVSLDVDGQPYWDENGTHRVILDTDGTPACVDADTPLAINGADGPELSITPMRVYTADEIDAQETTWAKVSGKPTTFDPAPHRHTWDEIDGTPPAAEVVPVEPDLHGFIPTVLSQASVRTVPIMFLGSSSTARNQWTVAMWNKLTKDYPSGGTEHGIRQSRNAAFVAPTTPGLVGYNTAAGGTETSDYVIESVVTNAGITQPYILIHEIGSNNWARGTDLTTSIADFRTALGQLDAVITVPHIHVLLHANWRLDQTDATTPYTWDAYGDAMQTLAAEDPSRRLYLSIAEMFALADVQGDDPFGFKDTDNMHLTEAADLAKGEVAYRAFTSTPYHFTGFTS